VIDVDSTVDPEAMRKVESYRKSVGARIRAERKRQKMTQDTLAEISGLPQSHICRLEQGKHAATEDTISRIANALGVDSGEIDPAF
jgi:HTH-type transcriptional regulator/antitoxin HipB